MSALDETQHDRSVDLALRDVPVAPQKAVLLVRRDQIEAVALARTDRWVASAQVPTSIGWCGRFSRCAKSRRPIPIPCRSGVT
jgi:hypothetical protein